MMNSSPWMKNSKMIRILRILDVFQSISSLNFEKILKFKKYIIFWYMDSAHNPPKGSCPFVPVAEGQAALSLITYKSIAEVRSYNKPPQLIG